MKSGSGSSGESSKSKSSTRSVFSRSSLSGTRMANLALNSGSLESCFTSVRPISSLFQ